MNIKEIQTSSSNRAKCIGCGEPIIKREARMKVSAAWGKGYINTNGLLCFKCSKKYIEGVIDGWKEMLRRLKEHNRIGKEKLNELKMARML